MRLLVLKWYDTTKDEEEKVTALKNAGFKILGKENTFAEGRNYKVELPNATLENEKKTFYEVLNELQTQKEKQAALARAEAEKKAAIERARVEAEKAKQIDWLHKIIKPEETYEIKYTYIGCPDGYNDEYRMDIGNILSVSIGDHYDWGAMEGEFQNFTCKGKELLTQLRLHHQDRWDNDKEVQDYIIEYMINVYILIGLPGSGKTTIAKKYHYNVVSSDAIRKELYGSEEAQGDGRVVFKTFYDKMERILYNGSSVVCDATNISIKARAQAINCAKKYGTRIVGIWIKKDADTCIEQQKNRDRQVPVDVIKNMESRFEVPTLEEGFDDIIIIS